ncbi:MAG: hypothetical protein ACK4E8_11785 [Lacibacter sp.]
MASSFSVVAGMAFMAAEFFAGKSEVFDVNDSALCFGGIFPACTVILPNTCCIIFFYSSSMSSYFGICSIIFSISIFSVAVKTDFGFCWATAASINSNNAMNIMYFIC